MKIFICCDGTWNDKDNPDDETGRRCPTNVRRFFDAVEKGKTQELARGIEIADKHHITQRESELVGMTGYVAGSLAGEWGGEFVMLINS